MGGGRHPLGRRKGMLRTLTREDMGMSLANGCVPGSVWALFVTEGGCRQTTQHSVGLIISVDMILQDNVQSDYVPWHRHRSVGGEMYTERNPPSPRTLEEQPHRVKVEQRRRQVVTGLQNLIVAQRAEMLSNMALFSNLQREQIMAIAV